MTTEKDRKRPSIECTENGPYLVKELENLTNSRGDEIPTKTVMALCRCGWSKNKPYCDGSHWYVKFRDDEKNTIPKADPSQDGEKELIWH